MIMIHYKGKGEHSVNQLEQMAQEFSARINELEKGTVFFIDCWDRHGNMETKEIIALNEKNAVIIFEDEFPDMGSNEPYT